MRARFAPDEADDADGLSPFKEDNDVWHESGRKDIKWFYWIIVLISQPLIYLLQAPFSAPGWSLFGYYKFWFLLTPGTFPAAFIGWYITKKNWLSLLILSPILVLLTSFHVEGFQSAVTHFPMLLLLALFCLGQVVMYLYTFTGKLWQKLLILLSDKTL